MWCVDHVSLGNRQKLSIWAFRHQLHLGRWSFYIWILWVQLELNLLVVRDTSWLWQMTSLGILGSFSYDPSLLLLSILKLCVQDCKMKRACRLIEFEVTMVKNSTTHIWSPFAQNQVYLKNSLLLLLLSKMVQQKERTELFRRWLEPCCITKMWLETCGEKLLTLHVIWLIGCTSYPVLRRLHMSYEKERSQM